MEPEQAAKFSGITPQQLGVLLAEQVAAQHQLVARWRDANANIGHSRVEEARSALRTAARALEVLADGKDPELDAARAKFRRDFNFDQD